MLAGGVCVAGGVHGRRACIVGGVHGGGVCGGGHAPGRYYEIWSISRRYASYWNAFLFKILLRHLSLVYFVIQTNEGPIGVV